MVFVKSHEFRLFSEKKNRERTKNNEILKENDPIRTLVCLTLHKEPIFNKLIMLKEKRRSFIAHSRLFSTYFKRFKYFCVF